MNGKIAAVLLPGLLFACAPAPPPVAPAPPPVARPADKPVPADRYVVIQSATCDTLLALAPEDRAVATMFYIGYQASRSRSRTINVGAIPDIEKLALGFCAAEPGRTVAWAFAKAYSKARR